MDNRQPLARAPSASLPQSPYNPNMTSAYTMPYQTTHLPPIQSYAPNMPPHNQNYMPQQYRPELTRYQSAPGPSPGPDRFNSHMGQHPMGGLPPAPMLPQPTSQAPQQPPFSAPQSAHSAYASQQPQSGPRIAPALAPAPPRPNLDPLATNFNQPPDRPGMWPGADQMPPMGPDGGMGNMGRDPNVHRVVGSQGRRGILPSAPGGAPVMPNGMNGSPRPNAMPVKDADGKFPCPNCNKTYLHAKHLKRHMLRHTGDRPYMCVLCNDTFSRSDILKRHFQKCSVRRGNPTGASHLSNPAAHLKKSQAAAAKANADSPGSSATPSTSGIPNGPFTSTSMGPNSLPATSAPYSDGPPMPYNMATSQPNDMHRGQPGQPPHGQANPPNMAGGPPNAWSMQNPRNPAMYNGSSGPPEHYGMAPGGQDDKRSVMHGPPDMHHDQWQHMFPPGAQDSYINPMFYDQAHHEAKKEYGSHEGQNGGYYVSSTSLGADGTLGPPLWHLAEEDPLQLKADRLVDFCLPAGLQGRESIPERQNNAIVRACLSADYIKHFLELFSNFQGHFPQLHLSTFQFLEAYDGVILAIICIGAVYSDRVSRLQVRDLMQKTKFGLERTSRLLNAPNWTNLDPRLLLSGVEFEELQALLMLQTLSIWHGGPEQRATARADSTQLFQLVRRLDMLVLAGPDDASAYSYLHRLPDGQPPDANQWSWASWIEQEKRLRFMYLVYLLDSALVIYFNCQPQFSPEEMTLPMPCDDAAWEAADAETCATALGLRGPLAQRSVNHNGSLRPKQLEMRHAMAMLHDTSMIIQPNMTNVYSKFILIHAIHTKIWHVQRQRSAAGSAQPSPTNASSHSPAAQVNAHLKSISAAVSRWKQSWDQDMQIQYPPTSNAKSRRRFGFCRDGVHFYWLAQAFLKPNRIHDWKLSADQRFQQAVNGLKKARDWSRSDGAQRGEEPGSVYDIDDDYGTEGIDLDMRKLFRPIREVTNDNSPQQAHMGGIKQDYY